MPLRTPEKCGIIPLTIENGLFIGISDIIFLDIILLLTLPLTLTFHLFFSFLSVCFPLLTLRIHLTSFIIILLLLSQLSRLFFSLLFSLLLGRSLYWTTFFIKDLNVSLVLGLLSMRFIVDFNLVLCSRVSPCSSITWFLFFLPPWLLFKINR